MIADDLPDVWYRARLVADDEVYSIALDIHPVYNNLDLVSESIFFTMPSADRPVLLLVIFVVIISKFAVTNKSFHE